MLVSLSNLQKIIAILRRKKDTAEVLISILERHMLSQTTEINSKYLGTYSMGVFKSHVIFPLEQAK